MKEGSLFCFVFCSIFKNFCIPSPNIMEPSLCTHPRQELSKDTKNTIWSIPVWWISQLQIKANYLPSYINIWWAYMNVTCFSCAKLLRSKSNLAFPMMGERLELICWTSIYLLMYMPLYSRDGGLSQWKDPSCQLTHTFILCQIQFTIFS
jgi:hypothetical protein